MDQGDPANGHLDGKPPQRSQQAKEDEAEEVPEGEEEEDAGDGEDEGPGEVRTASLMETSKPCDGLERCLFGPMVHALSAAGGFVVLPFYRVDCFNFPRLRRRSP